MIILGHHCAAILLTKMLIWAPFSQSMCTFSFCINPCIVKEFIVTKCSVMETQNLVANPKSEPVKSNSKQYQFLSKYIASKNQ